MYVVEFIMRGESAMSLAVASPRELFTVIFMLDDASRVTAWRINGHEPAEFGWSPFWKKKVSTFEQEHFT
jgi:hypothetical protein